MTEYEIAVITSALIIGAVCGAVPAITGAVKGKIGLGIGGFFACCAAGLLLGVFLAVPVCALFTYQIFKEPVEQQPSSFTYPPYWS